MEEEIRMETTTKKEEMVRKRADPANVPHKTDAGGTENCPRVVAIIARRAAQGGW